jgi:hypothetical protein
MVGYAVTTGAVTGWRYFVLSNIVEDALLGELRTTGDRSAPRQAEPERIRHVVLRGASAADVPLIPDEVSVSADGNVVTVRVRHVYPVLEYGAQRVAIPIVIERSRALP